MVRLGVRSSSNSLALLLTAFFFLPPDSSIARHFLIVGIPALGLSPFATSNNATATISAAADYFNARIEFYIGMIASRFPGAEASYFDSAGLMETVSLALL